MRKITILFLFFQFLLPLAESQNVSIQINVHDTHFIVTDPSGNRCGVDPRNAASMQDWVWFREIPRANYGSQGVGSLDPNDPGRGSMEFYQSYNAPMGDGIYLIEVIGTELGVVDVFVSAGGKDSTQIQEFWFELKRHPIDTDGIVAFRFTYYSSPGSPSSLVKVVNANSLFQDISAMRKLDWITTEIALDKYHALITTYGAYFEQTDYEAAKGTLNTMLQELASDSGSTITRDAYRLLQADVEQLIAGFPSSPPQTPISSYSLFATHSMHLEQNSKVFSGDIGVTEAGDPPLLDSQVELSVGIGVTTAASSSIKAHRIKVKQGATVSGDVSYNELENNGTIAGTLHTPLSLPLAAELPEFKSSTPGSQNIEVLQNGSQTLQPGSYGDILVRRNGRLTFTGGTYQVKSITSGDDARLLFQSTTEVRIAGKFDSGEGSTIGPEDTTTVTSDQLIFYVGGINGSNGNLGATPKSAKIGIANRVKANFYVPNGTLWIRQNSEATGAFIGKDVDIGIGVKVWLKSAF